MSDSLELPPRPAPPRRPVDVAAGWLAWFGLGRLVVSAVCVAVVAAGGWWLVRSPTAATEAGLPFAAAATGSSSPTSTLPPPVAAAGELPADDAVTAAVVVHVAGAVVGAGVYRLDAGARVHTAIEAAGGTRPSADLDGLNLAAPVADGERIYVPEVGEIDPASVPAISPSTSDGSVPAGPIDLNRASAADLEALPGVGPATAGAIIDDRGRHGPFASVDDLERVPGIGPAKLAAIRELVTV